MNIKLRKFIGALIMALGILLLVSLRIKYVDLTEGQAFIQHWYKWILSGANVVTGAYLLTDE